MSTVFYALHMNKLEESKAELEKAKLEKSKIAKLDEFNKGFDRLYNIYKENPNSSFNKALKKEIMFIIEEFEKLNNKQKTDNYSKEFENKKEEFENKIKEFLIHHDS
jgi:hypothetical protein